MARKRNRKDRSGVTLVELLVATLIGIIIFVSWLEICNPKPVRRESFRRLAVEQAAGYLDLMLGKQPTLAELSFEVNSFTNLHKVASSKTLPVVFLGKADTVPDNDDAVIGYTLSTEKLPEQIGWPKNGYWAVVRLYDKHGVPISEAGTPFFTLSAYIGGGN